MTIIKNPIEKITDKQLKYIEQLSVDLEFSLHRRNTHIISIIKRPMRFLDELTKREASSVITQFKVWKEQKQSTAEIEIENQE